MEMLQGKNKILLFRDFLKRNESAAKLVFQTEHTFSYNRELNRIETKDGTVVQVGELESSVSISAIQAKDDPVREMLEEAVKAGKKLELWEVTVDEDLEVDGKFPAVYCQGYLDSWENPANVEGEATVSSNFVVEMEPQTGMATLTDEQIEAVQYAFTDTVPDGGGDTP
ncbi:phage major tail protein, TP901-1 family [Ralstonia pickettii]|nr:phage major tail protein, TP901-1 family [Ralstonia pickettii]